MSEIPICPFCGARARQKQFAGYQFKTVSCQNCSASAKKKDWVERVDNIPCPSAIDSIAIIGVTQARLRAAREGQIGGYVRSCYHRSLIW